LKVKDLAHDAPFFSSSLNDPDSLIIIRKMKLKIIAAYKLIFSAWIQKSVYTSCSTYTHNTPISLCDNTRTRTHGAHFAFLLYVCVSRAHSSLTYINSQRLFRSNIFECSACSLVWRRASLARSLRPSMYNVTCNGEISIGPYVPSCKYHALCK
jgi:hypothetical protein